nr:immunoglobulin light chain junction region [Macaca mulatta]MOX07724.1 immunoglobulin light chain junction region [Macaca mulatta]MOX08170.1 immunoglobulin light chain junction region [Macaca mulatta]MOX10032.1 immunoglobulin light chain junction region [Macaca mulatta]
CMQTLEYPLTF